MKFLNQIFRINLVRYQEGEKTPIYNPKYETVKYLEFIC